MFKYKKASLENVGSNGQVLPILHGENFMLPINEPKSLKWESQKEIVIGHSETGHNHILTKLDTELNDEGGVSDIAIAYDKNGDMYIKVVGSADLYHKKSTDIHETVKVAPGVYKITHKQEYNPFAKIMQRVFD